MENQNNNSEQKIKRKSLIVFIILVVFFMFSMWGCCKAVFASDDDSKSCFVDYVPASTPGVEKTIILPDGVVCRIYPNGLFGKYPYVCVAFADGENGYHHLVYYSTRPIGVKNGNGVYNLVIPDGSYVAYDAAGGQVYSYTGGPNTEFSTRLYTASGYLWAIGDMYVCNGAYSDITTEVFLSSSVMPRTEVAGMTGQEIATMILVGAVGSVSCVIGLLVAFRAYRKGWGFLKTTLRRA